MRFRFALFLFLSMLVIQASAALPLWFEKDPLGKVTLHVDLFVVSTCSHCHKAEAFFKKLEKKEPWLLVHRYVINQDKSALTAFYQRLQLSSSSNSSVPSLFFCGAQWTGFEDESTTGRLLADALSYCYQQVSNQGTLSTSTMNVLQKWGGATIVHIDPAQTESNFKIIVYSALSDALFTCSFFCFMAFFAFIGMYPLRKWHQFSLGMVFLGALLVTHYVQQVYSAFYYQMTFKLTWAAVSVGLLLLFFLVKDHRNTAGVAERSPNVISYAASVFVAFMVQTYQQTCPLNFALIFEQWLTGKNLSLISRSLYQLYYQMIYCLPMIALILVFLFLGRHRRFARFHKRLIIIARLILVSIGIILLVYPLLLANLWASILVLFGSILMGSLLERRYE